MNSRSRLGFRHRARPRHGVLSLLVFAAMLAPGNSAGAQMSVGFNLWNLGWGSAVGGAASEYNYFATGLNWATVTNPWNPTLIAELLQAKVRCLRFMDWGCTNGSLVATWAQRIPKSANHYLSADTLPQTGGAGYGVAYEWMIDLCNRVNADMWVCVPHQTDTTYAFQLATLIKNNLNTGLRVYVEFSNECWNDGFAQASWLDAQKNINGLANPLTWQGKSVYGFGSGGDCRWSEYVYYVCRTMNQFNKVFGTNSPRVVKVMSGQAGWGNGSGSNQMCQYHLACLQSSICNPWGVKIDAYAVAPYWNATDHAPTGTESSMRASLADCVVDLTDTRSALTGSGIPLICYEGGPDNYSTQAIADSSFQYQLTIDALTAMAAQVQGIFNYYTFSGGAVWGLKDRVNDDPSKMPKWRGYLQWLSALPVIREPAVTVARWKLDPSSILYSLRGERAGLLAERGALSRARRGLFVVAPDNSAARVVAGVH